MNSSMATYTNHLIQAIQFIQAEDKYAEYGLEMGKVVSVRNQLTTAYKRYQDGKKLDDQYRKDKEGEVVYRYNS